MSSPAVNDDKCRRTRVKAATLAQREHVEVFQNSPTAESFGVPAQIGSGVVRGGPEVRFHEGTRVPPGFHQSSTRVPRGFHEVLRGLRGGASTKKSAACCWGYHLSLVLLGWLPFKPSFREHDVYPFVRGSCKKTIV